MKEWETVRIYKARTMRPVIERDDDWFDRKTLRIFSDRLYEVDYLEYNMNGEIVGAGSEDFSGERWRDGSVYRRVFAWDGKRYNKGGNKWFEELAMKRVRKSDARNLKTVLQAMIGSEYAEIQIRY